MQVTKNLGELELQIQIDAEIIRQLIEDNQVLKNKVSDLETKERIFILALTDNKKHLESLNEIIEIMGEK